ncbi:unnamed protein product (macronuclear) [Paramecium tetraurelia]|uniref:Fructose-bisphosphatase n=1 Tax=Paramecium tetraurelia TaxID=5888 RepID=A0CQ95_PARTE|nr:uncharacterized protein GSPATT00009310001 [Paramecium tetraurelia]CAK72962.1 unnamed protein product [Paramecium tetraurelia]|eukprot:XP_001440359.1 hypothetical protein (macronuclear) [Paramecium tetraurelia strain d4-2]
MHSQHVKLSDDPELSAVCSALLLAFIENSRVLRYCSGGGDYTNTQNDFGDHQLEMDVQCELNVNTELKKTGFVSHSASEETPEMKLLSEGGKFIVTFDPLDGSSIIGTNFAVGTIVAIWKSDENLLIGKRGRDMVSACCCLYGSRTNVVFWNEKEQKIQEYTLFDGDKQGHWELTKDNIKIKPKGKLFSPGNTRCIVDHIPYREVVDYWIHNGYTLRYSGGMAPDICQIFLKEVGVFSCFGDAKNPSKLRYLYECAPLSFLIEKAEGKSFNGKHSVLDTEITGYQQKSEIIVGSADEIEFFKSIWKKHGILKE